MGWAASAISIGIAAGVLAQTKRVFDECNVAEPRSSGRVWMVVGNAWDAWVGGDAGRGGMRWDGDRRVKRLKTLVRHRTS